MFYLMFLGLLTSSDSQDFGEEMDTEIILSEGEFNQEEEFKTRNKIYYLNLITNISTICSISILLFSLFCWYKNQCIKKAEYFEKVGFNCFIGEMTIGSLYIIMIILLIAVACFYPQIISLDIFLRIHSYILLLATLIFLLFIFFPDTFDEGLENMILTCMDYIGSSICAIAFLVGLICATNVFIYKVSLSIFNLLCILAISWCSKTRRKAFRAGRELREAVYNPMFWVAFAAKKYIPSERKKINDEKRDRIKGKFISSVSFRYL